VIQVLAHSGSVRRAILRKLIVLLVAYLAACTFLYFRQRHFLFFPQAELQLTPRDLGCDFEDVTFGADRLHGWWLRGAGPQTLIYYHGNGGNVGANAEHACRLQRFGFSVLIFDYRGYGRSVGDFPSEQAVYADAQAAWDFVTCARNVSPGRVILYGHSLGGAIAVEMARLHPDAAGLIAESTFTSVYDMGTRDGMYAIFPLRLLLNQKLDTISKIKSVKMPVLFIHGTADAIVPHDMSQTLFAAAPQPKTLVLVPQAGHENVAAVGGEIYRTAVLRFAGSLVPRATAVAR
jgi:uncharacterized protein